MMSESTQPPEYPATSPNAVPIEMMIHSATSPTVSEIRAPIRSRLNRSRPRWSVPSQCAALGEA